MKTVTLYTTQWCPFCLRAKSLLASKGVEFDEIAVDGNPSLRAEMAAMAGATTWTSTATSLTATAATRQPRVLASLALPLLHLRQRQAAAAAAAAAEIRL